VELVNTFRFSGFAALFVAALFVAVLALAATPEMALGQRAVRGVTRDSASGQHLAGALVEIRNERTRQTVRTDDAGGFRFGRVPEGRYQLSVLRIGYVELKRDLVLANRDTVLTLPLQPTARALDAARVRADVSAIYGIVGTLPDLNALPGAKVDVIGANRSVLTDSVGGFFVAVDKPGLYFVRITRAGFAEQRFPIDVPANRAVDGSRMLDPSPVVAPAALEHLWKEFDQRVRLRALNSAVVPGSEVRAHGGSLLDALQASPSFIRRGLRFGPSTCVFINGIPRPNLPLDAIRVEEVEAVEVYAMRGDGTLHLAKSWSGRGCGSNARSFTTRPGPKPPEEVQYVVVWVKP
jgi:hypothetical protein